MTTATFTEKELKTIYKCSLILDKIAKKHHTPSITALIIDAYLQLRKK